MSPPSVPASGAVDARRRRAWTVAGGVVGLVAAAAIGWWTFRHESQRISATTVSYRVVDDTTVSVSFDVSRPPGQPVTCTVRAMDSHFTVVGSADVVVPPQGEQVVHQQTTFRTTTRAVTGLVQDCVRT